MDPEIVIWGLPKGETEGWKEEILAVFPANTKAEANTAAVKEAAGAEGWHSFRVVCMNYNAPINWATAVSV